MRRTAAGDRPVGLAPQGIVCRTSPSPKGFYFQAAGTRDIWLYDEARRQSVPLLRHLDRPFTSFTVSPDGNWVAINFDAAETSDLMMMEHFR